MEVGIVHLLNGWNVDVQSLTYKDDIIGLGMDSTELGNPPIMFKAIYERAKAEGYELVAHCGASLDPPLPLLLSA